MAPGRLDDRNVRPRFVRESCHADEDSADGYTDEYPSDGAEGDDFWDDDPELWDEHNDEGEENEDVQQQLSSVSFGALKRAQDTLSKKRKRDSDTTADQDGKMEALRARLQEIKQQKSSLNGKNEDGGSYSNRGRHSKTARTTGSDEEEEDDDSDSAPSEQGTTSRSRSSKHAPQARSSRFQVSRKRNVVEMPKRVTRDPRFDALHNSSARPEHMERAYGFLLDYQKSEIAEMKAAVKATRDEGEKETLRRKIGSMENRIKAKEAKQREQDVVRRHRKEEREKVNQGKNPFYLKKKDIKEQALVDKFKGMKSKDREKLMERRRKKEGQKEKKRMPQARRVAD